MDSPQLFLAFGAIMLIAALLGVAIDWFGKPLRHRRFFPKVYRFPEERQPRRSKVRATYWSDASFVLPVNDPEAAIEPFRYPEPGQPEVLDAPQPFGLVRDMGPPTAQVPVVDLDDVVFDLDLSNDIASSPGLVTLEDTNPDHVELEPLDTAVSAPAANGTGNPESDAIAAEVADSSGGEAPDRTRGWRPGQYVFNLTPDGREPSPTTVRTRYWKNVAATAGAPVFGDSNLDRMGVGKPPQRLNHRTGKLESMRLPSAHVGDDGGRTPVPEWPTTELDPFA